MHTQHAHTHTFMNTYATVNFLRLFAVCGWTRNFLRLLAERILIFLRLELLADKAQFNSLFAACVFLWRKNFLRHFLRVHYFWAVLY